MSETSFCTSDTWSWTRDISYNYIYIIIYIINYIVVIYCHITSIWFSLEIRSKWNLFQNGFLNGEPVMIKHGNLGLSHLNATSQSFHLLIGGSLLELQFLQLSALFP